MDGFKVGLQLYSVRNQLTDNFEKTLEKVKEIGYDYVEFAGYYNKNASEIRKILDGLGLKCVSVHQPHYIFLENAQREIDFLKEIGARYCAIPWLDTKCIPGGEKFEQTMDELTQMGGLLKENKITLLYHNHAFEFEKFEGKYKLDIIYERIDSKYLMTEIDTCWVKHAGEDPAEYILKYKNRSPVVHLKDIIYRTGEDGSKTFEFCPLGQGVQDFTSIISAAGAAGTKYFIVEQDREGSIPVMQSVEESRKFLKTRFSF